MAISTDNEQQIISSDALGSEDAGEQNELAKHVAFFDGNDGIVYPCETYRGFREIGAGFPLSFGMAIFINIGLSQKTRPGKFPSLLFPIEIKNITGAIHHSDTGVYDSQGRFVPQKFEDIFKLHAHTRPDALTWKETKEMLKANRSPKDYFGRHAAFLEWSVLFRLGKDKEGFLHKDTIRAVYDGSLFKKLRRIIKPRFLIKLQYLR